MKIEIHGTSVLNDGAEIGTIAGDTVHLAKNVGPTVKAEIKRVAAKDLKFEVGEAELEPKLHKPIVKTEAEMQADDDASNQAPPAPTPAPKVTTAIARGPEPKQDPRMGTKDPAWQAWKKGGNA